MPHAPLRQRGWKPPHLWVGVQRLGRQQLQQNASFGLHQCLVQAVLALDLAVLISMLFELGGSAGVEVGGMLTNLHVLLMFLDLVSNLRKP